ncbi:hypothetical protein [Aliiroseovarius sp.]|uniref:hypothetical protein n=1 Tax=Aliiroseovarius sp. TaxID=1872442 RepID=UPI002608255D|nr:hypothetical protein [Aliiroseovarius sp.]
MGLESATGKLDKYFQRLKMGKARKIKPSHVDKIVGKLEAKAQSLQADLADTEKPEKKQRLEGKLKLVREQQERARWLLSEIDKS